MRTVSTSKFNDVEKAKGDGYSRGLLSTAILGVIGLQLTGCSTGDSLLDNLKAAGKDLISFEVAKVWIQTVKFKISADINNNAPVAVDLVICYDQGLADNLLKMSADMYFQKKDQLRADNPDKIQIVDWELTPGQSHDDAHINLARPSGKAAYVFARYSSTGDHRVSLAGESQILITLDKVDFSICDASKPKCLGQ